MAPNSAPVKGDGLPTCIYLPCLARSLRHQIPKPIKGWLAQVQGESNGPKENHGHQWAQPSNQAHQESFVEIKL